MGRPISTRVCDIPECGRPHRARGLCHPHYRRWARHGDPLAGRPSPQKSPDAALEARTEWRGECLEWTGFRDPSGYGYLQVDGRKTLAHRFSWAASRGPIPEGLIVRHKCDNPPCVRIDHLELGTHQDNTNDKIARHRAWWQKGKD